MRLYLDQMFRADLAARLRAEGHDVVRAVETGQALLDGEIRRDHEHSVGEPGVLGARQFFQSAVDDELLKENPFESLKAPSEKNKARLRDLYTAQEKLK